MSRQTPQTFQNPKFKIIFPLIMPIATRRAFKSSYQKKRTLHKMLCSVLFLIIVYRLRVRISVVTLAMKSSRLISVVSPLRSRTEMLPASASLAPSTSI